MAQFTSTLAAGVTSVLLARLIGPASLGRYSIVTSAVLTMTAVAGLGLQSGITYYVSRGEWAPLRAIRDGSVAACFLGLMGAGVTLAAWATLRGTAFEGVTRTMAVSAAVVLPFVLMTLFVQAVSLADGRYGRWGASQVLQAICVMACVVLLALQFGVAGAVIGFTVGQIIASIASFAVGRHRLRESRTGGQKTILPALLFGLRTWLADVLQLFNYRLDLFVLNAVSTSRWVGLYTVAISVTALGWILPHAVASVVYPRAARLSTTGDRGGRDDAGNLVAVALRHAFALVPVTIILLVAISVIGIPVLYGANFSHAVLLSLVLTPGVSLLGVAKIASAVTTGRGRPQYALYNTLFVVPITVGLYVVLIPRFGAVGAALSSTLSYALTAVLALAFLRRAAGLRAGDLLITPRAIAADYRDVLMRIWRMAARKRRPAVR